MKTHITVLCALVLIYMSANAQNENANLLSGFENGFHHTPVYQTSKGKWYYKNTDIVINSVGKNFYNLFETEIGGGTVFPNRPHTPVYFRLKHSSKITNNWRYGIMTSIIDYNYLSRWHGWIVRSDIFRKIEFSAGLTYQNYYYLHSLNFNISQMNHLRADTRTLDNFRADFSLYKKFRSASITYLFIAKWNSDWGLVADNKLYITNVDFLFSEDYCNFNFFLFEQMVAFRKTDGWYIKDFGALLFLGIKGNEKKITIVPYFSYSTFF